MTSTLTSDPRETTLARWAVGSAALIGIVLVVLGIDATLEQAPSTFNLDLEDTPSALFTAALLGGTGVMTWLTAGRVTDDRRGRRALLALGAFFVFMASDEALRHHEHLERTLGIDWQLLYLPVVAVGGLAWLAVADLLRRRDTVALALLIGGAAAWFAAQVFEFFQYDGDLLLAPWMIIPEEALEIAGTVLFLSAVLRLLTGLPALPDPQVPEVLVRIPPAAVAGVALLTGAVLIGLGYEATVNVAENAFDLDEERNVAAVFSTVLLLAGAGAAAVVARHVREGTLQLRGFAFYGAFLAFMAFDELFVIHERIEQVVKVDWQLLYLPVVAVGGAAWLVVAEVLRRRDDKALALHVAGAAAWFLSQVVELFQYDPQGRLVRAGTIPLEEGLEMLGSLGFLLAMLVFAATLAHPYARD